MTVCKPKAQNSTCSPARRAGAMIYDALVVIAIWMIAAAMVVVVIDKPVDSGNPLFQLYLMVPALAYFHFSWSRIGQTLGMRAWRIRLDPGAQPFTFTRSLKRFFVGLASFVPLGLGFGWALMRSDRRAWPDLASQSRLVIQSAKAQSSAQQQQPKQAE